MNSTSSTRVLTVLACILYLLTAVDMLRDYSSPYNNPCGASGERSGPRSTANAKFSQSIVFANEVIFFHLQLPKHIKETSLILHLETMVRDRREEQPQFARDCGPMLVYPTRFRRYTVVSFCRAF